MLATPRRGPMLKPIAEHTTAAILATSRKAKSSSSPICSNSTNCQIISSDTVPRLLAPCGSHECTISTASWRLTDAELVFACWLNFSSSAESFFARCNSTIIASRCPSTDADADGELARCLSPLCLAIGCPLALLRAARELRDV